MHVLVVNVEARRDHEQVEDPLTAAARIPGIIDIEHGVHRGQF